MSIKYKEVNKQELESFVNSYKSTLEYSVTTICEPPLASYNDFTNGKKWPESIVAKIKMHWLSENGETDTSDHNKLWKYFILDI